MLVAMMLFATTLIPAYAENYHTTDHTVSLIPVLPDNDTLPENSVLPGDRFTMSIKITDQESVGFHSTEIILTYNNTLFSCDRDTDNDGKLIYRLLPAANTEHQSSDWTCPTVYEFTATTDDIPTTAGEFNVKANVIETADDAFKDGDMSVTGSCKITIVNQYGVSYYDTDGNKITAAGTQEVINQGDKYKVPELERVAYHHLRWTIDDADSVDYMTSDEVNAEIPTADSNVYLHKIANTYDIDVAGTETATVADSYQYDGITDLVGTIDNYDARYNYTVTYSITDTPYPDGIALFSTPDVFEGEATITNGNTFTIKAEYLKGPVQLTITKATNVEIEVTDFVAGSNGSGWYLVRVYGDAAGYTFDENGTENAMYSYAGYEKSGKTSRVWLTQELTPATANFDGVFAKLKAVTTNSNSISVVGNDLNQDGVIDFKDATAVNAAYIVQWSDVQDNIARYIQADVTRDGALNTATSSDTNTVLSDANYQN